MSVLPIISEISEQGITARLEGDEVTLSAPKGTLTPDLISRLRGKKPDLLRSLKELQERAEQDWEEISTDPAKLKAFAELVMIEDMRRQGIVPDHYTATTNCRGCGPVPIFEGCGPKADCCPWCFNRMSERPMPLSVGINLAAYIYGESESE